MSLVISSIFSMHYLLSLKKELISLLNSSHHSVYICS